MTHYQSVTFIIPCRNNLKYLQQAVNSIENYYGQYHQIVILDDASNDGTWEWIDSLNQPNIKTYRNEGPDRVGHTVLYDIGISLAETPIVTILHSDMVVTKDYVSNMLKNLKPLSVVSATRIEPPLHPPGPEKYVKDFGMEPEEFQLQYDEFEKFVEVKQAENKNIVTNGIFAPWMLYKEDFRTMGGHDKLFAPMELEDSDIFNRFHLCDYELIQSRDAFVYHMTCRGSRFKDGLEIEREIPLVVLSSIIYSVSYTNFLKASVSNVSGSIPKSLTYFSGPGGCNGGSIRVALTTDNGVKFFNILPT